MGFWLMKRHSAPLPQPTSGRDGGRPSKQRMAISSSDHGHNDELDDHDRRHHHDEVRQRQPRRFMLFPWHRRQLLPQKTRAPPKSWSQSESEDLSPDNSSGEYNKHHGADGRRPFLRNSQRQRNSQDFADYDEEEENGDDDYADQVHDPRYRLEQPVKGNASMTSYAAASADVTKSFTLSTSSQSTSDTVQNHGRNQQPPKRSKHYTPMDGHANNDDDYETRVIHPIIHKRDIFIDTSRTPVAYQQQQHRTIQNSINNNNNNRGTINNINNNNNNVAKQQPAYHNSRPDPDTLIDILAETTARHTNIHKRPDPIEDMSFPTPKSHYSPGSFTSPRTTTSFNLPSYSVTGSMIYNAREQYGMESRAMQPGRGSKSPFKPTTVPPNSILASMLFRTTQLDDQPQSEQQQQPRGGQHHQRLPPSYGAAVRKEEEHQSEASSPHSQVDGYDYEDEEEEDQEVVEVQHVENPYRQDPDGGRMNTIGNRQQPHACKEPEDEFDPRHYYSEQHHYPEDFMNVPDDIIRPQGSGLSSVSSVTDMWATVVDHHWNHANSRMIDLLENAMQEKFPGSSQPPNKRPASSNHGRKLNQQAPQRYSNSNKMNSSSNNNNNNHKSGNLYEA